MRYFIKAITRSFDLKNGQLLNDSFSDKLFNNYNSRPA